MVAIRKDDYRKAAMERMKDAAILKNQERGHTTVYLMGFVLECMLAYCYCTRHTTEYIENVKSYNSDTWQKHERLLSKVKDAGLEAHMSQFGKFLEKWKVHMRYHPNHFPGPQGLKDANQLYDIALSLVKAINREAI
ncbi:hypothetical protein [Paenibacillus sp. MMS20-IR301]|uniref:hypothetical protein n=1 Tax=Paenibacillus sp. MMS20-IR301 TaxID=2895946 RepID=UPI0028EE09F5|nr:hypothetical protein [Paenibacillus sp. MMS20-IR301]WNS41938.1 hypothetical protein LOS79_23415 [Paenibacillus sp. MMS20-IR301]